VAGIARRALAGGRAGRVVWYAAERAAGGEGEAVGRREPGESGAGAAAPAAPEPDVWAEAIAPLPGGGSRFALCARGFGAPGLPAPGDRPEAAGPAPAARGAPAPGIDRIAIELPLLGRHNVENCVAAAAAALALGVPPAEVAAAAAAARPAPGRGVVHALPGGVTVIDDSYNSNPDALRQALAAAAALAAARPGGRRWAVLGSMLELGPGSPAFHREAGERAARAGFSPVAAVGEEARELAAAAAAAGAEAAWLPDAAAAAEWAAERLEPGDTVLVKGSRGIGLEAVVARLLRGEG
jgi:hypothetical protein